MHSHIMRGNASRDEPTRSLSSAKYICTLSHLQIGCVPQGKLNSPALLTKRSLLGGNQDCSNSRIQKARCFLLWLPSSYRPNYHLQENPCLQPREVSSTRVGSEARINSQAVPRLLGPRSAPRRAPSPARSVPPYLYGSRET